MPRTGRIQKSKPQGSSHLPNCPTKPEAYERLYSFSKGADDFLATDSNWQEIRIPSDLTEEEVYQLLPSAPNFEYGGYLTKTRICFRKCGANWARMPMSKFCTFHSHPSALSSADVPSAMDVYQFLNFRHVRAVTVGSTQLWIWDKTKNTLATVVYLATWAEVHMLKEVRRLEKRLSHHWHESFVKLALKNLGLDWPKKLTDWQENWAEVLRKVLKIKVRVFSRSLRANAP